MISNSSRGKQKFRVEITVLMQHEFFLSADANLPIHPILHAVNNFFNQLTIVFPFVKEESRSDFTSNFGTMKQRIKKFENPMDISVKLRFFHHNNCNTNLTNSTATTGNPSSTPGNMSTGNPGGTPGNLNGQNPSGQNQQSSLSSQQ